MGVWRILLFYSIIVSEIKGGFIMGSIKIKGLDDLEKKLNNMQKKLKKYEGEQKITLPYSEEEWQNMTEYEQNEAIEEAKNKYIEQIKKDLFK